MQNQLLDMESTPYSKLFSRDSGKWLSREALALEKMKEYGKKHWMKFIGVGLASVLLSAAMVGVSIVLQYAIDFTMEGRVWEAVAMVASFLVLFAVLYGVRNVGFVSLNQKFLCDIRAEIVEKILRKDYLEFEERKDSDYLSLLTKLRQLPNVKKVFVRSGIRYDYLMYDKNDHFFEELVQHHISGQLKVAPEHISNHALDKMGKPRRGLYEKFVDKYYRINEKYNKKQFLVPYLMSSHPGCRLEDAIELAEYLRDIHHQPEQVQDFYPTPGTLSTTMYYTGLDPRDMTPVYVPKDPKEKAMQRALIQYKNPKNYDLVYEALIKANRKDLIGFGKKCLIKPRTKRQNYNKSYTRGHK